VDQALTLCRDSRHTRLPVWAEREGRRRVIGLLSCDRLFFQGEIDPGQSVAPYVRPVLFLDEDMRLEVALQRMQRGGHRLAIVLNRERLEIGMLSLQDVLGTIFGEVSL
jgi:CBS domain containing-hemolysin-like protein